MAQNMVAFSLPKIGEAHSTNQDRFARSGDGRLIALADGAGSSLYPGQWAELLVKSFCHSPDDPIQTLRQSYQEWLKLPQAQWRQYYLEKLQSPNRKWWQGGSQLKACGFSTFLGLRLIGDRQQGQWQAVAIGDSCLFKLAAKTHHLSVFPSKTAQSFKCTTQCFASLPEYASFAPQFAEGEYQAGDIFLLATDALSHWLLSNYERQAEEWKQWFGIRASKDFTYALADLRNQKQIQNDDTTMILLNVCSEKKKSCQNTDPTLELKTTAELPQIQAKSILTAAREE
ncbi:MAG: protein phosphatase 2C domain-containing protein [Aphanocapsa sp. GSE-SYN-MK-11-07L]|jgi:serine/threonine protein phosphatase PrpC|nr:protein phosphatase 2C domain-containing protein [Aphanocapsa sp. GSE-SYN-MK-11-07L]